MKKTFVTVTLLVAMAIVANAARYEQDNMVANTQTTVMNKQNASLSDQDIYREYVLQSEENEKHIIRYYDINRIVITNKQHALIRIYDDKWRLIEQTDQDVDKDVRAGNYYVTCSSQIKGSYKQW